MYVEDLVILSPFSAGLQQILAVSASYGAQYDIAFNPKKSFIVIATSEEEFSLNFQDGHLQVKCFFMSNVPTFRTLLKN